MGCAGHAAHQDSRRRAQCQQLETMAELAEEYSDGIAHVTTRQDFQLHYVHIDDTPSIMRRLAAAEITTREACGNSVRNVTACPFAGVCQDEVFDVTPYSRALSKFLLGHPDCQNFGRKFKPAFSGCAQHACGLASLHDLGLIADERTAKTARESAASRCTSAADWAPFLTRRSCSIHSFPQRNCCRLTQAIARVFARLGEKKNRSRARIKFLIQDLGIEKFRELVLEERKTLPPDPRWTEYIEDALQAFEEAPLRPGGERPGSVSIGTSEAFDRWLKTNTRPQKQAGYVTVTVTLPLGDITANQLRSLADIVRRFTRETIRTTVEQNFVIRWVSKSDLPEIYNALHAVGLGDPGAGAIVDVVACPGTDTCKLGISSSRGLAGELRNGWPRKVSRWMRRCRICTSRSADASTVAASITWPTWASTASAARSAATRCLISRWCWVASGRTTPVLTACRSWPFRPRTFRRSSRALPSDMWPSGQMARLSRISSSAIGKAELKKMLEDLTRPPATDRSFFTDWGDPREYSLGDMGMGECAGEVVSPFEFEMAAAERELFEGQLAFEAGQIEEAGKKAYRSMLLGAKALVKIQNAAIPDDPDQIVSEFRTRYCRYPALLGSLCRRQIRQLFVRRPPEGWAAVHAGLEPLPARRSAAFHRRCAQLQQ